MTFPGTWHVDVFFGSRHPEEALEYDRSDNIPHHRHDAAAFPTMDDVKKSGEGMGKVRYTIFGRNRAAYRRADGWRAKNRYVGEHYDLKEILDPAGNVVSTEHGHCCIVDTMARL
jgi:hypothetical protein